MQMAAPPSTSSTTAIHRTLPRSPAPMAASPSPATIPRYGAYLQLEIAAILRQERSVERQQLEHDQSRLSLGTEPPRRQADHVVRRLPHGCVATLDEYLVKKAPFQIPEGGKEFIVRFGPWISLVLLLMALPFLLIALGLGAVVAPFAGVRYSTGFGIAATFALVQVVMLGMALPGLFARKMSGWTLLFYEQLVGFVGSVLSGSIIGGIIGALIGLYILFQGLNEYSS